VIAGAPLVPPIPSHGPRSTSGPASESASLAISANRDSPVTRYRAARNTAIPTRPLYKSSATGWIWNRSVPARGWTAIQVTAPSSPRIARAISISPMDRARSTSCSAGASKEAAAGESGAGEVEEVSAAGSS